MTNGTDNFVTTMPVAPAYSMGGSGFGGGFGGWGNDIWLIIIILFAFGGFGNGFGGGFGGGNLGYDFPWLINGQNGINNNTNAGFQAAATQSAISGLQSAVTSGFGDVQTALCIGFAGVNATVNGEQNAISQQLVSNQIADMQQAFAAQTATTQGFNGVQSGLADIKYTVATENCADRTQSMQNTRDIMENCNRNNQAILDKLCQLELDGVKAQVEAKKDRIAELESQLNMANLQASQTAQNAFIAQGFSNEVDQLYTRLSNCPVPSVPVYGRQNIFQCNQNNGCGCGCGGSF